ncbi:MAG: bifunctional oligoribonuclease/PAP phosphatase NrnA [Candidatus Omnitrophica bacterium]|nr:bifunctional oligoribonuclease/PAP phosphatase NrnA [Candidatus Omnitrophota bacterium]
MPKRSGMKAVMEAMRAHRRFMVSSHINPEGDALGSAIALASLLKRMGKHAVLATTGGIPAAFDYLPRLVPVFSRPDPRIKAEVSMIVDVPALERVGSMEPLIRRTPLVVCVDHHVSNQLFADVNWVEPKAAAVGEMIYELYKAFRIKPSREEAYCMYVSLVTDTGSFKYMNTTPKVHRLAAELIARGISPLEISQHLYESRSASDLRFLGFLLRSIRVTAGGKIAWLEVPCAAVKKFSAGVEILDELVNFPRSVETAEIAFVLKESTKEKGVVRVSFRSKGRVDVDQLARVFGGGGHMAASGCTMRDTTLAGARLKVLRAAREALTKQKR